MPNDSVNDTVSDQLSENEQRILAIIRENGDLPVATDGWWVIGCRKAGDGAMEIAAAFPIPPAPRIPEKEEIRKERKLALDDQIRGAKGRV